MPKCPHCNQPVTLHKANRETGALPERVHKEIVGWMQAEVMYSCPHCDSILGFAISQISPAK